jgi:hypothetical protein
MPTSTGVRTKDRRLPRIWSNGIEFRIYSPDHHRLGMLTDLVLIEALLSVDPDAEVRNGKHGWIELADADAWLTFQRRFALRDYLPDSYVSRVHSGAGVRYFELQPSEAAPHGCSLLAVVDRRPSPSGYSRVAMREVAPEAYPPGT